MYIQRVVERITYGKKLEKGWGKNWANICGKNRGVIVGKRKIVKKMTLWLLSEVRKYKNEFDV